MSNFLPKRPAWVLPMIAGFVIPITAACYLMLRSSSQEDPDAIVAKRLNVTEAQYKQGFADALRLQRTHVATEEDMQKARSDFNQRDNLYLRQSALTLYGNVKPNSAQAAEGIMVIKGCLADPHTDPNLGVVGIVSLKRLGDPSWKAYAKALLQSPDEGVREMAQVLLSNK